MKLLARDKFESLSSPVTKEAKLPFKKVRTGLIQRGFGMDIFAMGTAWFLTKSLLQSNDLKPFE